MPCNGGPHGGGSYPVYIHGDDCLCSNCRKEKAQKKRQAKLTKDLTPKYMKSLKRLLKNVKACEYEAG